MKLLVSTGVLAGMVVLVSVLGSGITALQTIATNAATGITAFLAAGTSFAAGDFGKSETGFATALASFSDAENMSSVLLGSGAVLAQKPDAVQSARHLIAAGKLLATVGAGATTLTQELSAAAATWPAEQALHAKGTAVTSPLANIGMWTDTAEVLASELRAAETELQQVTTESLPADAGAKVTTARTGLEGLLQKITPVLTALHAAPDALGMRVPRRYLILLQNSDELRPTGGFVGSYVSVTLNNGFVENFQIHDIYETANQIVTHEPPHAGLEALTNRNGLQDANYTADFPTSAAEFERLFELARTGSADGIVAITSNALERIVGLTGGLNVSRLKNPVTASDIVPLLELVIESKVDGSDAPKKILPEVWQSVSASLKTLPMSTLAAFGMQELKARDIQVWSPIASLEQAAVALGIDGTLPVATTGQDMLAVSRMSLSGNKSDRYMESSLSHATVLEGNGMATDTLTLYAKDTWTAATEQHIRALATALHIPMNSELLRILGAGKNVTQYAVAVPAGATLMSITGAKLLSTDTSDGRTIFTFQLSVSAGETASSTLVYTVPVALPYHMQYWQQAGVRGVTVQKSVVSGGEVILDTQEVVAGDGDFAVAK